jgi:hypothetical protein
VQLHDLRRQAIAQWIEDVDTQVPDHPALAGQPPASARRALSNASGRASSNSPRLQRTIQAATPRATAKGDRNALGAQGIQKIDAGSHRPPLAPDLQFRHRSSHAASQRLRPLRLAR